MLEAIFLLLLLLISILLLNQREFDEELVVVNLFPHPKCFFRFFRNVKYIIIYVSIKKICKVSVDLSLLEKGCVDVVGIDSGFRVCTDDRNLLIFFLFFSVMD